MPLTGLTGEAMTRFGDLLKAGVSYRTALALADRVTDADLATAIAGGGGGGAVASVNGKTGAVVLTPSDLAGSVLSVAGRTGAVVLAKADVGLSNVDNTSDANKPVSTATNAAISAAIANLVNGAPGALDTLAEIDAQLASDESAAAALTTTVAGKLPVALVQRGVWAPTTAYALYDVVIAPTGDLVVCRVAHTSGASYSGAGTNWAILVPAAGFPGHELASAVLTTTANISCIGPISSLTDTTHDVDTTLLDVSPVIGSRPIIVEAYVQAFFGTTGAYGVRLVDKTANLVLAQSDVAQATAFQIQEPAVLRWIGAPAAGTRKYGIRVNGTAGTNNMILDGSDNLCATWIRVVER